MRGEFVEKWKSAKIASPKLEFYDRIKSEFGPEKYLDLVKCPDARKSLTRLRISAHNLSPLHKSSIGLADGKIRLRAKINF